MRVLVVTNMYPTDSSSRRGVFVQREVDELKRMGHDLEVVRIDVLETRLNYFTGRGRVLDAARIFRPDVIHVHYGLTLLAIPRGLPEPLVATFHGSDLGIPWQRWVTRLMMGKVTHAILVASDMREALGRHATPTSVIPCGAARSDASHISREEARVQLGLSAGVVHVLFPSSPRRREKRFELFEKALARIPGAIGVTLDDVDPYAVQVWLRAVDCVLLTSRREGSPVVTKEALCAGVRVVSVDVGDVARQLEGFNGCAIALPEPSSLARAVTEVLAQEPPDALLARKRFDIGLEARAVESVYSRYVGRA